MAQCRRVGSPEKEILAKNLTSQFRSDMLVVGIEKEKEMFSNLKQSMPPEFVDDVIAFCKMFYTGSVACTVHGDEHQEEMLEKWPREWMEILFTEVGSFIEATVEIDTLKLADDLDLASRY